jgi:HSP20 family protein
MSLVPRHSLFDFDHFFDHLFSPNTREEKKDKEQDGPFFAPRIDLSEKDGHYLISAELPGVNKEDIHITLENGILSIEAESRDEKTEEKDGKVIFQERRYGKFVRSFNLGLSIQESDIEANFNNGILKLSAPKALKEDTNSHEISIH